MTTFSQQLQGFSVKIVRMEREVFHGVTEEVQRSIVFGSEITAAPGQIVDTGALKASWTPQFTSESTWQTTTHLKYAPSIEDGVSYAHGGTPITQRSPAGGFHSVKLTRVGFPRIVDFIVRKVRGSNGS
jgi:hypothetical protein